MKKVFVLLVVMVGSLVMLNDVNASEFKKFEGTWAYKVPSAPYEYSTGQLIVNKIDGKEAITIKFSDGSKAKAKNVKCENGTIKFGLYVDYDYVSVSCKLSSGKLTGEVDSPEGKMNLTAEKKN